MKNKKIIYKNFIQEKYLNFNLNKKLNVICSKIFKDVIKNLDTSIDTFHMLSDKFQFNFKRKDIYPFKRFKNVVIIGMGGSILGSQAIYFFLRKKIKKNFLFLDNIDLDKLEKLSNKGRLDKTLFIVISKSGGTIETLSNFISLRIIKKNSKNIVIISEKNNNSLYKLSKKMKLKHIEHKNYIGGRYSVLSEVGMIPAYLMGLNIQKIRKNLLTHLKTKNKIFLKDSVIKLTNLLANNKFKNLIFFNYVPQLENFLYWNQQLIAESLGKKEKGFLPLISSAPKDHHSLLQLYLDGPKDKLFYIFSTETFNDKKIITKNLDKNLDFLNNKTLNQIKIAQKNAFIKVLKRKKIPFREFIIKDFSEESLGELFSYFILETALIGKLSNINPFDQPAVEQVKIDAKRLLI